MVHLTPSTTQQPGADDSSAQAFQCSQCGGCCNQVSILHPKAEADKLLQKPWVQGRLEEFGFTEFENYDGEHILLPHKPDKHCVFLEDNRCLIDKFEGHLAKPIDCRRFPFARPISGINKLDTSAACITIARGLLNNQTDWQPANDSKDISGLIEGASKPYGQGSDAFPDRGVHRRHGWLNTFSKERLTATQTTDFFNQRRETFLALPPWQALRWLHQEIKQYDAPVKTAAQSCKNNKPPLWKRRLAESRFLRQPYGWWTKLGILQGDEISDPRVFGRAIIHTPPADVYQWPKPLEAAVTAFAWSIAQRSVPLIYGHSLESMLIAATLATLIAQWYAEVLTYQTDKETAKDGTRRNGYVIDKDSLILAFRVVERYYTGHQPAFLERVRRLPALSWQLDWLLA